MSAPEDLLVIPHHRLSAGALTGLIEEFVTRDGTDSGYTPGIALARLSLGRCLSREGRTDEAREHLESAVSAGRSLDQPGLFVPALAHLAGSGGSADAARDRAAGNRTTRFRG